MPSMSRTTFGTISILLAIILFLCANIIAGYFFRSVQLDLTETGQYTLSQGTDNILQALDEPVTLRFFFSEELANQFPQIRVYGNRIRDLLRNYASRAGGRIRLEIINPAPFTEQEDIAVALGITAVPLDSGESLYMGLAGTNSVDGREVIPFFAQEREPFLEYDLTELVFKLGQGEKPKLGILSSLPLDTGLGGPMAAMQGQSRPFIVYDQLVDTFDVQNMDPELSEISEDIEVLMIVHPTALSPSTLYAIDQFVLGGGRALVFVDPLSEVAQAAGGGMGPMGPQPSGLPQSSNLEPLFEKWGVEFDDTMVVGDLARALRVQSGVPGGRPVTDYVVWLGLNREDVSQDDLVTANINNMNLGAVGGFVPRDDSALKFQPLIQSTSEAMLIDAGAVAMSFNPDNLITSFAPTGETYVIAARLSGTVETAFPDGPPPEETDEADLDIDGLGLDEENLGELDNEVDVAAIDEDDGTDEVSEAVDAEVEEVEEDAVEEIALPDTHLAKSAEPGNIIVVADTDIFDDKFWVREQNFLGQRVVIPTADNATFITNAVENLMGSNDLISLRSRARDDRPLTAVDQLRRQAEAKFLAEQQRLEAELAETERRLAEFQAQGGEGATESLPVAVLTAEEEEEIDRFQVQLLQTRQELRRVQRDLRADIEVLETQVKFANIALMPILIALLAVVLAYSRQRCRAAARRS